MKITWWSSPEAHHRPVVSTVSSQPHGSWSSVYRTCLMIDSNALLSSQALKLMVLNGCMWIWADWREAKPTYVHLLTKFRQHLNVAELCWETKPSLSLLPLLQLFHVSEVNKWTLDHVWWHTSGTELCFVNFFLLVRPLLEPSLERRREKEGFPCSKNFFIQFPLRRGREDGHSSHTEARRCGGEGVLPATSHVPLLSLLPTWKKTPWPLTNSFSRWKNKKPSVTSNMERLQQRVS